MNIPKDKKIVFLLKTLKSEYLESTMKKGRFCFNPPSVFNRWEDTNTAQYDKWDGHSCEIADKVLIAPIIQEDENGVVYGEVKALSNKAIIHTQSTKAKQTPICCFRSVDENEIAFDADTQTLTYSLGNIAERIINEFGHDSFILILIEPFIERIKQKYSLLCGSVIYKNIANDMPISVDERYQELTEELFRKDEKYMWQKEFRIALTDPTTDKPFFIELGSIEDIAISGRMEELLN